MDEVMGMSELPMAGEQVKAGDSGGHALLRRVRLVAALAMSAVVFWYFGPWAVRVADPSGPVSLLLAEHSVISMAELLGLAVVVSGLAVAICGAGSGERGPLAVAVGLATLGLRGGQMDGLILARMGGSGDGQVADLFPAFGLIAETCLWLAVVAVGFIVGRWVEGWFEPADGALPRRQRAGVRMPEAGQILGTVVLSTLAAWLIIANASGSPDHPIMKGQVYFTVSMGLLLGSLLSDWLFRTTSRAWVLASIALLAAAAYLWGAPPREALASAQEAGTYVALPIMSRPLPLEYAALGSIGALIHEDALAFLRAMFGVRGPDEAA
jgi:hypothetical protein